jgi:hypothetical protein
MLFLPDALIHHSFFERFLESCVAQEERSTGWSRYLPALAMFVVGFAVAATLLHLLMRNQLRLHADIRSEKLLLMDQWQGKAYSAAFGSSHVHNGFDPRSFDLAMSGTPLQTRTLNLAIAGGSQTEQRATALAFLKELHVPPKMGSTIESRACIAVLELGAGANFTNDHLVHPRAINIYDADTTKFVWHLTSPEMGLKQRVGRVAYAAMAMAMHYMNVGMVSSAIFAPPIDKEMYGIETVDDRRGLLAMQATPKERAKIQQIIDESGGAPEPKPMPLLPGNSDLLTELAANSPVKNLTMSYLMMPMLADLKSYPVTSDSVHWSGGEAPVIDMARPDLYPELYQARYWMDDAHLNEQGAKLMTTLMAKQLKQWYAAHGEPQRCGG